MPCIREERDAGWGRYELKLAGPTSRSNWKTPASTSISLSMREKRFEVETTLTVGTKGKLVIEPFPVEKKMTLHPEATYQ